MDKIATILVCLLAGSGTWASELTPERFLLADVEAQEKTLDGMAERIRLLQEGASEEALVAAEENAQTAVAEAFAGYETDAAAHAAYGTQYADEVTAWLEASPELQARYQELSERFGTLSEQLDALNGGN